MNDSHNLHTDNFFLFKGLGIALITPFKPNNEIDYENLERLIDHVIGGGADYLVIMGTTAETPTLSPLEKKELSKFIRKSVNFRVPLVLGLGGNCTSAVVEQMLDSDLTGYSALLSVSPYYNKPSQKGLYLHFSEIAKNSRLPIILYNVPGRTGVNIEADTCLKLARDHSNIIGVKEASGNLRQIEEIIDNRPAGFEVISGDDSLTYSLIKMGASGVISVVGNAFPKEFGRMVKLCLDGNYEESRILDNKLAGLYEAIFRDGNPAGIKSLLHSMGMINNILRLPLVPSGRETDDHLKEILEEMQ